MGCGGSKGIEVVLETKTHPVQDTTNRQKTPSESSSSGVSSYRHSQSLKHGEEPGSHGTQDFHQKELGQEKPASNDQTDEELRLAEQKKREAEMAEEERRLQEQARAGEEERRRQQQLQTEETARFLQVEEISRQGEGQRTQVPDQTGDGGRRFTPIEIAQHNAEVGWVEWISYKGKVYDGNGFKHHFPAYMQNRPAMLEARARQRVAEGAEEKETEFVTFLEPIAVFCVEQSIGQSTLSVEDPQVWKANGIYVLRYNGISEQELAKELPPFLLGTITGTSGSAYFDSLRKEVGALLRDLEAEYSSPIMQDYTAQLRRWLTKYSVTDPPEKSTMSDGTDPNDKPYPMPPIDLESLRLCLRNWEPFDLDIPPEGAWESYPEPEKVDLGDPHELFSSSLRDNFSEEELAFDIEGEAAWELLLDNAIKDGVMTAKQQEIQAAREKRTDLNDPERMKKRREQLRDYFIETRELAPGYVMTFMQWASVMEANQAQLEKLADQ